jgi:hypothetical protein
MITLSMLVSLAIIGIGVFVGSVIVAVIFGSKK